MRLFVAVDLPEELRRRLGSLAEELRGDLEGVRWVRPEGIHLTLKFVGEMEESRMAGLSRELAARVPGSVAPFQVRVSGTGVFPASGPPRVVWVGLHEETGSLANLQQRVEQAALASGIPAEQRAFRPHLTLGRVADGRGRRTLRETLVASSGIDLGAFTVSSVCLFRSLLKAGGAEYQRLEEYGL
ncbi:MAG TPA: RNA 2',3'-cyclic phosphodiesterase [Candidatus Polarisedimenticolia bacterium]|nr:RNA 2',3'-cyclic phosphodiesterase [Candidatus Polarisedimenticolia bacterium]